MERKILTIAGLVIVPILLILTGIDFLIGLGVLFIGITLFLFLKTLGKREAGLVFVLFFIFTFGYFFYYNPAVAIAKGQGTVLSDNWWEALNWIKNNTDECAVIATYWDPGHFITGIARRPVVFDGASQSSLLIMDGGENRGLMKEKYENGITQIIVEKDNKIKRGRIKDIATSLMTTNESLAIDILKNYKKPGCDEMYYIASSDLIFKSVWWTYFATWDPGREDKGDKYSYVMARLERRKPLLREGVVGYEYPISSRQSFILYDMNGTINALFQQDNQFVKIRKIADRKSVV